MKFSIITTFYNNTIEEVQTIKNSILNQTYTKWEWIISDDFSKDSTAHIEILKNLPNEDKRIKYVEQNHKKEIFWNPQTYASGDIVMLIGADDWISHKALEIFNYHFIKYPDLILITSESNILTENLQLKSSTFLHYKEKGNAYDRIKHSTFHNWLNMGVPLTWRNIPIDFTEGVSVNQRSIINDYLIHLRLEEIGKFTHLPRVFYNCKIRPDSVSRKIDDDNDFTSKYINEVKDYTYKKRGGRVLNSFLDIYNSILEESEIFYYSDLNNEKNCQNISFVTPRIELSPSKEYKLKELYIDHNLSFNKFSDEIDYYFFYLKSDTKIEDFMECYNNITSSKEITIFLSNPDLSNEILKHIQNYWWFGIHGRMWIKHWKK